MHRSAMMGVTTCATFSIQRPTNAREAAPTVRPPCATSAHGIARSLLIADVTADFIIADPALALLFTTSDCDDIITDVIIADSRSCASCQLLILDFFQSAMLMSSLLLVASSSRHADVIIAESRFLFASIQQLISTFFALLILDFYCSSYSSTFFQQTS
ncbi:tRNA wybutosine-synthesizing protein 2/3/4 [Dorcoceras hygrometricum]|uniref:tRNA wybutosine-synthesizing protein 2/3/4 n=1 Tax=Dorcoceras hygrometricum TaxID=472368 RepID=A0A2Z7CTY9_9LAMI|nr:tRNA wybutosine-synthesizing protein 2/3/4 [Dorcoceras hygrometricum]